jgi:hypothetical protein
MDGRDPASDKPQDVGPAIERMKPKLLLALDVEASFLPGGAGYEIRQIVAWRDQHLFGELTWEMGHRAYSLFQLQEPDGSTRSLDEGEFTSFWLQKWELMQRAVAPDTCVERGGWHDA